MRTLPTHLLQIPKMMCLECVHGVTRALHAIDPGARVEADVKDRTIRVASALYTSLIDALEDAGFKARPILPPLG